jgi:hypothetical protein
MLCHGRTPALIGYINEAVGILKVRRVLEGTHTALTQYWRVLTRHAGADSVHQRGGRRLCARSCASPPGCVGSRVDLPIYRARGTHGYSHGTPGDSSRTPESVCRRRGSTCRSSARRPGRRRRCFNNIMCATTAHLIRRCSAITAHLIRRCSAITASAECNVQHQLYSKHRSAFRLSRLDVCNISRCIPRLHVATAVTMQHDVATCHFAVTPQQLTLMLITR